MRTESSISIRVWLCCSMLALAVAVHGADAPSSLQAAKDFYRAADFDRAVPLLHAAVQELESQRDAQSAQLADAYLYLGMSYCALGDSEAAKDAFRKLLGVDPSRRLDPSIHAPKVIDLFERARLSLPPEPAPVPTPSRLPRDRWLTVEFGRQQPWLSSREPLAGLHEMPFDEARAPIDFGLRASPDFPAINTQLVRVQLPWSLGDVRFERRGEMEGVYNAAEPPGLKDDLPTTGDGFVSVDSKSIVWSRPFWSGTTVRHRPLQHRWEVGYRHVDVDELLYQDWWPVPHRRGHRSSGSEISLHAARGGVATAIDLGWRFTVDLGLGGTVFFSGSEDYSYKEYLPRPLAEEPIIEEDDDFEGYEIQPSARTTSRGREYGLHAQGQIEARLQWDSLRLRWGAVHVAVTAFCEFGGPAGRVQPNATIATRGVSAVIGLDLGPRP